LLDEDDRRTLINELEPWEADAFLWDWKFWARPAQLPPPGDWRVWLVMAGRGFGKTRTGAEWIRDSSKHFRYVNIVGPTADDARDIMIEGESGILAVCPPAERPDYQPSKRRIDWPSGARTLIFTADEPERLRGKQHERLWADEVGSWRYGMDAWDQAMFGLRLGTDPRCVATTTPKPVGVIRHIMKMAESGQTVITRGATRENEINLAEAFFNDIVGRYQGTRLGRQELEGELLEDVEGALWSLAMIDASRVPYYPQEDLFKLERVVVGVDPAATNNPDSNETGIIVAARGSDGHGYVLDDRSMRGSPNEWGGAAVQAYRDWQADHVTPETNNGGDMVVNTLRTVDPDLPIRPVHASRGKATRAEPVAALYEQGRIHHVGTFPALEDQMAGWVPGMLSPDRMDALVWALTDVMIDGGGGYPELPTATIEWLQGVMGQ
jgi:phage terminase large subunit-like protein